MALKWNRQNGNWLISASRDHFCKLFDIRNLKEEVQCFRGHKKEACSKLFFSLSLLLFTNKDHNHLYFFYKRNKSKKKSYDHQINVNKAEIIIDIDEVLLC
jgi:WD40 repeat protein